MSSRPAISTMRRAFGRVRSSGTLPATGVMPSIFSSGDRIASRSANASSTPGSVSTMTLRFPPAGSSAIVRGLSVASVATGLLSAVSARPDAEVATNSRRVIPEFFISELMHSPKLEPLLHVARRLRHQPNVEVVQFLCVHVELDSRQALVGRDGRAGRPEERLTVAGPVIDVDIDVEFFLAGDH